MRGLVNLGMSTLEGVLPRNDHEVALGAGSAERVGKSVGDELTVVGDYGTRTATVTGIVVLPSVGAFLSDRAGLGTGGLLSAPFFARSPGRPTSTTCSAASSLSTSATESIRNS